MQMVFYVAGFEDARQVIEVRDGKELKKIVGTTDIEKLQAFVFLDEIISGFLVSALTVMSTVSKSRKSLTISLIMIVSDSCFERG